VSGPASPGTRAAVGLALVLLLGALVWQGMPDAPSTPPVAAAAPVPATSAPAPAEAIAMPGPPLLDPSFAALAAAAASAASAPLAADEIEVCGVGRVKARDGHPLDRTLFVSTAEQAHRQLVGALARHPDEMTRAAGLLLQRDEGPAEANAAQPCEGAGCEASAGGVEPDARRLQRVVANEAQRDALARMAAATRSPAVYTLAWRACQASPGGSCQLLSTRQLVTLDPNNVDAWLEVASEAVQRGEPGAVDEAFYRASKAGTADLRWGQLGAIALRNLPPGTPALQRQAVAERAMGIEAMLAMPGFKSASQYCDAAALRDANRLQVCADLAEVMARRSTSLLDMAFGQMLGSRVGWPAERLQALRQDRNAIMQAMKAVAAAPGSEWSCAHIERSTRWVLDVGQFGEVGAARMLMARTGQDPAVLARKYEEERSAAAARAASGAASGAVALTQ